MSVLKLKKNTSFLFTCKENYFLGIHPADDKAKDTDGYKTLVQIARSYFEANFYDHISSYFVEGRYLIQLWAAHLIMDYGEPDNSLKNRCLKVIEDYIANPLNAEAAMYEKEWLQKYLQKNQ